MGTWGTGPFDNDTAADWCDDLDDADPARRPAMIEQALVAVVEEDDYLDSDLAVEAIAAAAIVAAQRPVGPRIDSAYAPDFVPEGGNITLPDHLPALALRALDRIVAAESEWRDLWEEADSLDEAVAELTPIRAALTT